MIKKITIDTSGHRCPIPILKARKAIATLNKNDELILITTDVGAKKDMKHFCQENNFTLKNASQLNNTFTFVIIK